MCTALLRKAKVRTAVQVLSSLCSSASPPAPHCSSPSRPFQSRRKASLRCVCRPRPGPSPVWRVGFQRVRALSACLGCCLGCFVSEAEIVLWTDLTADPRRPDDCCPCALPQGGASLLVVPHDMTMSMESDPSKIQYVVSNPSGVSITVNGSPATAFTHADSTRGRVVAVHDGSTAGQASLDFAVVLTKSGTTISSSMELKFDVEMVADTPVSLILLPMKILAVRTPR